MSTHEFKDESTQRILENYTEIAKGLRQKMWITIIVAAGIALAIVLPFASNFQGGGAYILLIVAVLIVRVPVTILQKLDVDKITETHPNFKEFYREYSKSSDKRESAALLRIAGQVALLGFVVAGSAAVAVNKIQKNAEIRDLKNDIKDIENKLNRR